jgi:hypothetical protein
VFDFVFAEGGEKFLFRKRKVEVELHAKSRGFADGLRHSDPFAVQDGEYMYVMPKDVAVARRRYTIAVYSMIEDDVAVFEARKDTV